MEFESIVIPATNDFASLYIEQKNPVKGFFHYDITENTVFKQRFQDVMERKYDRLTIAQCIEAYMSRFPHSDKTNESLEKLKHPTSTVVIGGQQAGLLTGPLYTIHKIISIVKLAEEQEKSLGTPVIPVFWIAGEDHDFLEINHVYAEAGQSMKKISYPTQLNDKKMTSEIHFDKEEMQRWVSTVFMHFGERKHTNNMLHFLQEGIQKYDTMTDLFSFIIMALFKDYGLLIIDSADPQLRKIEVPFFIQLIERNKEITKSVLHQQDAIRKYDFKRMIEIEEDAANLFYYLDEERQLLSYNSKEQCFESKKLQLSREELKKLVETNPERLSNNVVTRPLMQEWLFPSLAFIAGPGEIAYWGELKQAFELLENKMPPIIPRLNMTFLERTIERDLHELQLSLKDVLINGIENDRSLFMDAVIDKELNEILNETKLYLEDQYKRILERFTSNDRGLLPLTEKNLSIHLQQLSFLKNKAKLSVEIKHATMLEKYNRIERCLRPNGAPQERIWNIFFYLNEYGEDLINELMSTNYLFDGTHKIIKM